MGLFLELIGFSGRPKLDKKKIPVSYSIAKIVSYESAKILGTYQVRSCVPLLIDIKFRTNLEII